MILIKERSAFFTSCVRNSFINSRRAGIYFVCFFFSHAEHPKFRGSVFGNRNQVSEADGRLEQRETSKSRGLAESSSEVVAVAGEKRLAMASS